MCSIVSGNSAQSISNDISINRLFFHVAKLSDDKKNLVVNIILLFFYPVFALSCFAVTTFTTAGVVLPSNCLLLICCSQPTKTNLSKQTQ
jgi:hypothetical protein